jgi:hypothetical protein
MVGQLRGRKISRSPVSKHRKSDKEKEIQVFKFLIPQQQYAHRKLDFNFLRLIIHNF